MRPTFVPSIITANSLSDAEYSFARPMVIESLGPLSVEGGAGISRSLRFAQYQNATAMAANMKNGAQAIQMFDVTMGVMTANDPVERPAPPVIRKTVRPDSSRPLQLVVRLHLRLLGTARA